MQNGDRTAAGASAPAGGVLLRKALWSVHFRTTAFSNDKHVYGGAADKEALQRKIEEHCCEPWYISSVPRMRPYSQMRRVMIPSTHSRSTSSLSASRITQRSATSRPSVGIRTHQRHRLASCAQHIASSYVDAHRFCFTGGKQWVLLAQFPLTRS